MLGLLLLSWTKNFEKALLGVSTMRYKFFSPPTTSRLVVLASRTWALYYLPISDIH